MNLKPPGSVLCCTGAQSDTPIVALFNRPADGRRGMSMGAGDGACCCLDSNHQHRSRSPVLHAYVQILDNERAIGRQHPLPPPKRHQVVLARLVPLSAAAGAVARTGHWLVVHSRQDVDRAVELLLRDEIGKRCHVLHPHHDPRQPVRDAAPENFTFGAIETTQQL